MIETLQQTQSLPHSEESERAVLAGVLLDPGRFAMLAGRLTPEDFFSEAISVAQRLPNGNTLVCNGCHGQFFEVTKDGKVVWRGHPARISEKMLESWM